MQADSGASSDNHTDSVLACQVEDAESPIMPCNGAAEGVESDNAAPETRRTPGFQSGNQLWRRRQSADSRKNRQALREAFHKALTPDKMAKAVRRMLVIINADDKKAAVAAFKVLTEAAGIKADADNARSGPSFTFILPGPGDIPVRSVMPVSTDPVPELIDADNES